MGAILSFFFPGDTGDEEITTGLNTENIGSGVVYGCTRNVDACGRIASNGPGQPGHKGPPNGPAITHSAPVGHPDACKFDGKPDCTRCPGCSTDCPTICPESESHGTAADVRLERDNNKSYTEYGNIATVYTFSGKAYGSI